VQGAGLSGGQAQRVAVARAVFRHLRARAGRSPSTSRVRHWMPRRRRPCGAASAIADDGATVLLISHRRSAREIADRVVTLSATPAEVGA
jgi:ATP-binding cassette subfamily C protein CydD